MRPLEEVRAALLAALPPAREEQIPLEQAAGRTLISSPIARVAVPPADTVGMDGYAVIAEDVRNVPRQLAVVGRVAPGDTFSGRIQSGQAVRAFTGAPLPAGADAVVCQEDTTVPEDNPLQVTVHDAAKPWDFIRFRGEDIREGTPLLTPGTRLRSAALGYLAAAGIDQVSVATRPRVGVLVTGSELVAPGQTLKPGQIHESNGLMLRVLLEETGATVERLPTAPDTLAPLVAALREAWSHFDAVVTSGGASVGEPDLVRAAIREVGGQVYDGEVAMKPGKPFFWGVWQGRPLFGLPGNPVSAFVTAVLLVQPALRKMTGAVGELVPTTPGILGEDLTNGDSRRHFVRVVTGPDGRLRSSGVQASHRLASLALADGVVDIPPRTTWTAGRPVQVFRW